MRISKEAPDGHGTSSAAPTGWITATTEQSVATSFGKVQVLVGGNASGPAMVFWPSLLLDASMWSY